MVHVARSLNLVHPLQLQPRTVSQSQIVKPAVSSTTTDTTTASPTTQNFCGLFASEAASTTTSATIGPSLTLSSAVPTAESVFGANPWVTNPVGRNPDGTLYSYNPTYFATADTAAKVAQLVGGQVVAQNALTGSGGPYQQLQPNLMVEMPNGRLINPGVVASFYTHGYPQSTVDQMIANEVAG